MTDVSLIAGQFAPNIAGARSGGNRSADFRGSFAYPGRISRAAETPRESETPSLATSDRFGSVRPTDSAKQVSVLVTGIHRSGLAFGVVRSSRDSTRGCLFREETPRENREGDREERRETRIEG